MFVPDHYYALRVIRERRVAKASRRSEQLKDILL